MSSDRDNHPPGPETEITKKSTTFYLYPVSFPFIPFKVVYLTNPTYLPDNMRPGAGLMVAIGACTTMVCGVCTILDKATPEECQRRGQRIDTFLQDTATLVQGQLNPPARPAPPRCWHTRDADCLNSGCPNSNGNPPPDPSKLLPSHLTVDRPVYDDDGNSWEEWCRERMWERVKNEDA